MLYNFQRLFQCFNRTLEFEHGLIVERADRIKRIEGDILDVNQIMRELGALVYQQGDVISKFFIFICSFNYYRLRLLSFS